MTEEQRHIRTYNKKDLTNFEKSYDDYLIEFSDIRQKLSEILKENKSRFSVDQIFGFDSLTVKKIKLQHFTDEQKQKVDFSILSAESYFNEEGEHLRTRSNLFVKKLSKIQKIGNVEFYNDFIKSFRVVVLFNRHKALVRDLETYISIKYFENEARKIVNDLFADVADEIPLPFAVEDEVYKQFVSLLNQEKDFIKDKKSERSEHLNITRKDKPKRAKKEKKDEE